MCSGVSTFVSFVVPTDYLCKLENIMIWKILFRNAIRRWRLTTLFRKSLNSPFQLILSHIFAIAKYHDCVTLFLILNISFNCCKNLLLQLFKIQSSQILCEHFTSKICCVSKKKITMFAAKINQQINIIKKRLCEKMALSSNKTIKRNNFLYR